MATGSEASWGLKPFAAAPRPEPMHGASSHPNPRNVASLRSRNQARFSCLISDSSLLLTAERRFAPTTVRYRRISVRYESEQVSAFIGIRSLRTVGSCCHVTQYIAYFRVSTRHQGHDGNGMNAQRDAVTRFVSSQKGQLLHEFSEVESGGLNDRPQLNAALDECRRSKATLVVAKLDRLSRNAQFLLSLQNSQVNFVCCD